MHIVIMTGTADDVSYKSLCNNSKILFSMGCDFGFASNVGDGSMDFAFTFTIGGSIIKSSEIAVITFTWKF